MLSLTSCKVYSFTFLPLMNTVCNSPVCSCSSVTSSIATYVLFLFTTVINPFSEFLVPSSVLGFLKIGLS